MPDGLVSLYYYIDACNNCLFYFLYYLSRNQLGSLFYSFVSPFFCSFHRKVLCLLFILLGRLPSSTISLSLDITCACFLNTSRKISPDLYNKCLMVFLPGNSFLLSLFTYAHTLYCSFIVIVCKYNYFTIYHNYHFQVKKM